MKKKRSLCLVTGGAGFIGSHMVEGLLARHYSVRVLDNLSTGFLHNLSPLKGDLHFQKGDFQKEADVKKAVKKVDYVFHFGANRAVLRSVDNPLETNEVNVTGTLKLLLASRQAKVKRFVFSSSSSVYGFATKYPCSESDPASPESPYAASKMMGEYYCSLFWKLYGLSAVSLRYFNVFGPRQNPESRYSAVIPIFIDQLLKRQAIEVHWDGKQSRDFSYVDNVVEGNLCAMNAQGVSGDVFNIACNDEYSILDILHSLQKILKIKPKAVKFLPKRAGDVRRTFADISKAKRKLGFKVQTRFFEGLEKTVAWFLEDKK